MTEEIKNLPVPVEIVNGSLVAKDLDGLWRIASIYAGSGVVPKEFTNKPEKVFVVLATGLELGLGYMAALQSIGVINGKPAVYGDGIPGIIQSRGECEEWNESYELDGEEMEHYDGDSDLNNWPKNFKAVCTLKRQGFKKSFKGYFSVADAIRQGSWNKPTDNGYASVWQKHPLRMLKMRARGFAARDGFADHLKGLGVVEELRDIPQIDYEEEAEVVKKPVTGIDAALELKDSQPVVIEADDTKEQEKPQETPLSESEAIDKVEDHLLVVALLNRGFRRELIDAFVAMAAEHNDVTVEKAMNEAFPEIDAFAVSMTKWGLEFMPIVEAKDLSTSAETTVTNENEKEDLKGKAAKLGIELKSASELGNTVEIDKATGRVLGDEEWTEKFHAEYNKLKKTDFSHFVLKNTAGFAKLYKIAPSLYQKAQLKWKRFYPKDEWPVSAEMREGE
jgi:hypothetical protein